MFLTMKASKFETAYQVVIPNSNVRTSSPNRNSAYPFVTASFFTTVSVRNATLGLLRKNHHYDPERARSPVNNFKSNELAYNHNKFDIPYRHQTSCARTPGVLFTVPVPVEVAQTGEITTTGIHTHTHTRAHAGRHESTHNTHPPTTHTKNKQRWCRRGRRRRR